MIRDILVIKDGLPLFTKNYSDSRNFFSDRDELILISGFLSALNSFSDQFEDLGTIQELKLSNTELRLSFLKETSIPNLIFLASYDKNSESLNVEKFLRKISKTFLQKFNLNKISNWSGKMEDFETFEEDVHNYIKEEINQEKKEIKSTIVDERANIQDQIEDNLRITPNSVNMDKEKPKYTNNIPSLKISKNIDPKHYLTGRDSVSIFNEIDGKKTIEEIARSVNLPIQNVYNTCKNLIKLGFVSFKTATPNIF
jgi:predicted transcriptional regulator